MLKKIDSVLISFSIIYLTSIYSYGKSDFRDSTTLRSISRLESAIKKILEETNSPALGIALVDSAGPIWIAGLGRANIEEDIKATENTMFRIASVSKIFVALAILKLQEEGKLHLEDKIHDLVPEIKFENIWEATNPVRIVHLLEHTSGWDEIHLIEIAHNVPIPVTLKDGLDFHPHSRTSRWIPGTRKAYCNSGYALAGYIVEKVSGMKYEEYVKEHFLMPLNMKNTTFFNDRAFQKLGAVNYDKDLEPLDYKHTIYRPAGAMNSSPHEIANLVRLLLNRGTFDTSQLVSENSISRMEISQSTPGAKAGLQLGYGLANFTSIHNGFIYHGHDGAMDGGLAELAYLPDYGVGHVLFLSASNGDAFLQLSKLIRDFETQTLKQNTHQNELGNDVDFTFNSGYYVPINPRSQGRLFLDYLFGSEKIEASKNLVTKSWIFSSQSEKFIPVSDSTFRRQNTDKIALVKSFDPLAGNVLYFDRLVMKPIPGFIVFFQLSIVVVWIILMMLGGLIWIILCIRSLIRGSNKAFILCSYVTLTSFLYAIILILTKVGYNDTDILLAKPGILSVNLMLCSVLILISSVWSVIIAYRLRNQSISKFTFWHMTILSCLHLLVTIYLSCFGVIPIMTWT